MQTPCLVDKEGFEDLAPSSSSLAILPFTALANLNSDLVESAMLSLASRPLHMLFPLHHLSSPGFIDTSSRKPTDLGPGSALNSLLVYISCLFINSMRQDPCLFCSLYIPSTQHSACIRAGVQ